MLALASVIILVACVSPPASPIPTVTPQPTPDISRPPDIDLTTATTYPDGRPITDQRFAGVQVVVNGDVRVFDDIGRMVIQQMASSQEIAASWVRDYEEEVWIPANEAVFVGSANLVTPRGSGLLAVDSAERAILLARTLGGRTLTWVEIGEYLADGSSDAPLPSSDGSGLGGLLEVDGK